MSLCAPTRNSTFDAFILGGPFASNKVDSDVHETRRRTARTPDFAIETFVLPTSKQCLTIADVRQEVAVDVVASTFASFVQPVFFVQKTRKARRDKQTKKACARCRLMKLKCDSGRPCLPCMRRGCAASCVDWDRAEDFLLSPEDESNANTPDDQIERPIRWKSGQPATPDIDCAFFRTVEGQEMQRDKLMRCHSREFLDLVLRKVFSPTRITDWTNALTDDLSDSLTEIMRHFSDFSYPVQQFFAMRGRFLDPATGRNAMMLEDQEAAPFACAGVAYARFEVATQSCLVNEGYCRMMNCHPEELVGRCREADFCHALTEIDTLCSLVADLQLTVPKLDRCSPSRSRVESRYCCISRNFERGQRNDVTPALVHKTVRANFNDDGTMQSMERFIRPITPEEYDLAKHTTPHLCRPFAAAIGDDRSGQQLLAEYEAERWCSLRVLQTMPLYTERLAALSQRFRETLAESVLQQSLVRAPHHASHVAAEGPEAPTAAPSSDQNLGDRAGPGVDGGSARAGSQWASERAEAEDGITCAAAARPREDSPSLRGGEERGEREWGDGSWIAASPSWEGAAVVLREEDAMAMGQLAGEERCLGAEADAAWWERGLCEEEWPAGVFVGHASF